MKIIIFINSGGKVGLGHLTRSMALVNAFKKKNHSVKIITKIDKHTDYFLKVNLFKFKQLNFTKMNIINLVKKEKPQLIVFDSYELNLDCFKNLKKLCYIATFDDKKLSGMSADIIINGLPEINKFSYQADNNKLFLLGRDFQVVREQFLIKKHKRMNFKVYKIVILAGGLDVSNKLKTLAKKIHMINLSKNITSEIIIIVGPHVKLQNKYFKNPNISFIQNPKNIHNLLFDIDLAISASGQTLYELAVLGVPTIGFVLSEDQLFNLTTFANRGVVKRVGNINNKNFIIKTCKIYSSLIQNYKKRKKMSFLAKNFIDGKGAIRIVKEIEKKLKL